MKRITEFKENESIGYFENEKQFNDIITLCNKEFNAKRIFRNYNKYTRKIVIFPSIHYDETNIPFQYMEMAKEEGCKIYKAKDVINYYAKFAEQNKFNDQIKLLSKDLKNHKKNLNQIQKDIEKVKNTEIDKKYILILTNENKKLKEENELIKNQNFEYYESAEDLRFKSVKLQERINYLEKRENISFASYALAAFCLLITICLLFG